MKTIIMILPCLIISCGVPNNIVPRNAHERRLFGLLQKFDRFDYDGNGKLTKAEVRLGIKESKVKGVTEKNITRTFTNYDDDRDGSISFGEAQKAMRDEFGSDRPPIP